MKVVEEMIQINGQIQRAVANRDAIAKLMKNGKVFWQIVGSLRQHVFCYLVTCF